MNSYKNDIDIMPLFEKVEELRKEVIKDKKAMEIYNHLKEINKNDILYGWMFNNDEILIDDLDILDLYQKPYIMDILKVYKNELENILIKKDL